jgi:hypothetical protein
MSNEFQLQLTLNVANPSTGTGYTDSIRINQQYSQNAQGANAEVVSVPTTATSFSFANLTTYGWGYFQNLDTTNFVQLGLDVSGTFTPFCKLKPGEVALFRLNPGMAFQMQADTAAVFVNYVVWND